MSATQIQNRPVRMFPLLDAIAKEIVERSATIAALEIQVRTLHREGTDMEQLAALTPRLANQRRGLLHALREIEHLGWQRDAHHPLRFMHVESGEEWKPEHSGFYLGLAV